MFLHRLFAGFPRGWPGVGLLLLRCGVGVSVLHQSGYPNDAASLCAVVAGTLLLPGLLTPVASTIIAATSLLSVFQGTAAQALLALIAIAVALIGPGAISLDARLFGRREIIIPQRPSSTER